jgi:3-oxoacyl-[acyl-carrier protein] reductase
VAIVTGGARGIGREITRKLAGQGYAVVVHYFRNLTAAEAAVDEILAENGIALAIRADVTDELDVERLFSETSEAFTGVDVVVDAAGLATNPRRAFVDQYASRQLRTGGALVNVCGADAAGTGAIAALTRVLTRELRGRDITVNAVAYRPEDSGAAAAVADVVAFLVSSDARGVSGRIMQVGKPGEPPGIATGATHRTRRDLPGEQPPEVGMGTIDASTEASARSDQLAHWQMMRKILVATDGSLSAADAISFAVEFASHRQGELIFVHVVPSVEFVPTTGTDAVHGALRHVATEHDQAPLHEASAVAAEHGLTATTVLLGGSTADEIVAHADSCGADLIVIGSRGHGAVASALLGSVALGVLHAAKQPVVVIRCALGPNPPAAADPPMAPR